jgi:hypothetical protein
MRRHPPHHLSPAWAITRRGRTPKRASAAPNHHSNALIKLESQSILSKIVADFPQPSGLQKRSNIERIREAIVAPHSGWSW